MKGEYSLKVTPTKAWNETTVLKAVAVIEVNEKKKIFKGLLTLRDTISV